MMNIGMYFRMAVSICLARVNSFSLASHDYVNSPGDWRLCERFACYSILAAILPELKVL